MASIKDIAARANVSVATVSHVLNSTKALSPEVVHAVRDAASALGYRPNETARALRTGRSNALGLIVPDLTNPYFPTIAQVIQQQAWRLGYALFLIDSAGDVDAERNGFDRLTDRGVDGVIWAPTTDNPSLEPEIPTVAIDRFVPTVDCVSTDHRQSGAVLGHYAASLGHQRIGFLNGPQSLVSARYRRAGIMDALPESIDTVWERDVPFSLSLPAEIEVLLTDPGVTLVVGGNDAIALSAMHSLSEAGFTVPDDVSVLGFDDIPLAQLACPPLTTVQQPLRDIGSVAVQRLHERLTGVHGAPEYRELPGSLVERRSARSLPETVYST
ncbi:LacI family DNA-binding transcriptional regulator [Salinisphaera sp. USBA-960]|uniref:LacI family DNA-binding transcriptional regulator n=1 Tax=Salinisphaera orenii TaxID=856731 RepID=UPI0013A64422|nr:LacI family DNA-binding transcriptional regulator [Salifodinibacter halophilus]NNC26137.1 LacI family DNA-binding transcriptional regulator [Salifodinibacter halophilus]